MKTPSPVEMQLLALLRIERSGREIAQRFHKRTGMGLPYGTLYTALRRMKQGGWVSSRDDRDQDGRLRYFLITHAGIAALDVARSHYSRLVRFGGAR